jgi:hypothetical protein
MMGLKKGRCKRSCVLLVASGMLVGGFQEDEDQEEEGAWRSHALASSTTALSMSTGSSEMLGRGLSSNAAAARAGGRWSKLELSFALVTAKQGAWVWSCACELAGEGRLQGSVSKMMQLYQGMHGLGCLVSISRQKSLHMCRP